MTLTGDGKMGWFFNEYVYGTALPGEKFTYSFSSAPDGTPILNFKVEQSGVDSSFRMTVPVYIELRDGALFGSAPFLSQETMHSKTKSLFAA